MQMTGEQRIAAPRERVWAALNDPEVLRQCIPGCRSLSKEADDRLRATVEIKIGPIGAKFDGAVTLSELNPPESYVITGQGHGGTVGTAKGGARVRLASAGAETILHYEVDAEVGGRLAQLGGPIVDATAKQLAGKFFDRFSAVVGGAAQPVPAATAAPTAGPAAAPARTSASGFPWAWIAAVVLALFAGYHIGFSHVAGSWVVLLAALVVVTAAAGFEAGRRGGGR